MPNKTTQVKAKNIKKNFKTNRIRKIGVSTGGGDCPGLNAVIRAVVKTAINVYDWEVLGIEDGFDGLIDIKKTFHLNSKSVRGILPRGGTILGTTNRGNPFKYKIIDKSGREKIVDYSKKILGNIKKLKLDALVVIGGDGTLSLANKLFKMGIPVVGVPKTIDNDLSATDITFGFDTAINTATDAIDKLHTTAESHHRVMVIEVMGRDAGWIAVESGIAGGADVILIPEIPFDIRKVCEKIKKRNLSGSKFSIVVAAEGAMPIDGMPVYIDTPSGAQKRLGGIGEIVADKISEITGLETRVTVLGHLQRGGEPTAFDRILGTRLGVGAVELVANGKFGRMVCLKTPDISSVSLDDAVGVQKKVPIDSDFISAAKALGIAFGN